MIPPRLASRPVQSSTVGQTIDPVVTSTQLPAASSYSNPFGNIAYSSTSAYDDLLARGTERYNALRNIGNPDSGVTGADDGLPSGLFPKIPIGDETSQEPGLPSWMGGVKLPDTSGSTPDLPEFGATKFFNKAFGTPQSHAYSDMILESLKDYGWGEDQRKYAKRHGDYLSDAAKKIGTHFTKVEVPKGYEGTAYVVTGADGKRYIIDAPHSPGGNLLDIDLGEGATGLGLGGLGGSGEYKNIPGNAGASYIAYDDYKGAAPKVNRYTDINVSDSFFKDIAPVLGLGLGFIPGLQGLGTMIGDALIGSSFLSPVVGNAVIGGAMSGLSGGNPLTGALAGGLGTFVGGSNIGGQLGISDPAIRGAVNNLASSGTRQLVGSGQLNPESLLLNAGLDASGAPSWLKPIANLGLTNSSNRGLPSRNTVGGLSQYLTSGLPSTSLATRQPRRPSWSRP
jgi:hypothetical protein